MTLTPKQQLFVSEYLLDLNATQAAIRAGYSRKTAKEVGYENLTKPHIAAAIDKAKAERLERNKIDAAYILERLTDDVKADMADLFTDSGALLPITEWPLI